MKDKTIAQNIIWVGGINAMVFVCWAMEKGKDAGIRMAENIASTPPSLLGIDRKMV